MGVRMEGIDWEDGGEPLLDLRFADDILVFATSLRQAAYLFDELLVALADVGVNEDKTKLLTTQAQPPKPSTIPRGLSIPSGNNRGSHRLDRNTIKRLHQRLSSLRNRNIFRKKAVSLLKRLRFFDKNCGSCCMSRRWPQKDLQSRSGNDRCSFSPVASFCRRPPKPNKLAEPMARNFKWLECSGRKICSGGWRFDVVALAFVHICVRSLLVYLISTSSSKVEAAYGRLTRANEPLVVFFPRTFLTADCSLTRTALLEPPGIWQAIGWRGGWVHLQGSRWWRRCCPQWYGSQKAPGQGMTLRSSPGHLRP